MFRRATYLLKAWVILCAIFLNIGFIMSGLTQEAVVKTLTLQESIEIALEQNLKVKTAKEKVETASQKAKEAFGAMLPSLTASGSYTYFGELPTTIFDFDLSALGLPPELLNMIGAGQQKSAPSRIPVGQENTYRAGLALQQPVFMWGKLYNDYKQAMFSLAAANQELESVRQQVELDVTTAFYGVMLTRELVKVAEMAVDQVQAHVKTAQDLLDAGMATNFDVLRAKVQLANTSSQLIRARNGLKLSKDGLKSALGMDLNAQIEVSGELVYQELTLELDQLLASAMENRPEIKQLRYQEQMGMRLVSLAKAGNKPNLVLAGNYNLESYANKPRDIFDSKEWDDSWSLTLALNFPLFDGLSTRARVKQAESGLRQIQLGMDQLMDGIGLEVRSAYFSFQESKDILQAQSEAVQLSEESLRIGNLRHKNGMITTVEFMDTELAFTQAQTNYFNALHDYVIAIARLEKASASKLSEL